jgi:predicted amidohydrolase
MSHQCLRAAAVQFESTLDKDENLARAKRLVTKAANRGAELVVLPEKWNGFGDSTVLQGLAEPLSTGPSVAAMAAWAAQLEIVLVGGSITERREDGALCNTCLVFDRDGRRLAEYRKLHMFDVDIGSTSYRESDAEEAGTDIVSCDLLGWRTGLSICYDLRFPEQFRAQVIDGAHLLVVPAAFTLATGRDHWELLLRARAVENQCFVIGANQRGAPNGRPLFGRSMIVDPWGIVLAQAPDTDCVIVTDLDAERQRAVRESLPALTHRRDDVYGPGESFVPAELVGG